MGVTGRVWPNLASLALAAVPPVQNVFGWCLVSDVFQPDALTIATHVADHISIATSTAGLKLCDVVVQVHLLTGNFGAPAALSVI